MYSVIAASRFLAVGVLSLIALYIVVRVATQAWLKSKNEFDRKQVKDQSDGV